MKDNMIPTEEELDNNRCQYYTMRYKGEIGEIVYAAMFCVRYNGLKKNFKTYNQAIKWFKELVEKK